MNRKYTNIIRTIMDEWLPPSIRDSRWFMYPFFWYWFKGKNLALYMDLKRLVADMKDEDLNEVYRHLDCRAGDRPSDSSEESLDYCISKFDPDARTLLDVGCGRGYFLKKVANRLPSLELAGCDVKNHVDLGTATYHQGSIFALPFADKQFDIVTCQHTIEHLIDVQSAIKELVRVCRKQLIIITPKQRYYYYTLDLHLNFYPEASYLLREVNLPQAECTEIHGDWVYLAPITAHP